MTDRQSGIRYPGMRLQITAALESMADMEYQQRVWIERLYPTDNYYDDFDLAFHILFDDTQVCSDPASSVGDLIYEDEVDLFRALGDAIAEVLCDPALVHDADYLADRRWPRIVQLASESLQRVGANGDGVGSRSEIWTDEV